METNPHKHQHKQTVNPTRYCCGTQIITPMVVNYFFRSITDPTWCQWHCQEMTFALTNLFAFYARAIKVYIHPNIWHEGVFAIEGSQRFLDRQGAVHARVSVDFAREFQCLLEIPLSDL
jgi:hypothetical protein